MDIQNTLNNWKTQLSIKLNKESFYNMILSDENSLQIVNEDYISIFNNLTSKKRYTLAKLEDVSYLNKAMNDYIINNPNTLALFSNKKTLDQKEILDNIISKNNNSLNNASYNICYLTFGMLTYILDEKKYQAPLVFLPIKISYSDETETFHIESINSEVILNTPLIEKIKKAKKLDLSYPVNKDFSLGEFIYYISIKVKPLNWTVNNVTCVSCFDFSHFYNLKNLVENETIIGKHEIIKKISYFNSEFFNFSHNGEIPLNNKYLSLLDLDNEEYNLLRTISKRDNVLIRCGENTNKYHFLSNIISSYMLNNKSLLVVYSSKDEKEELKKELKSSLIDQFTIDLNINTISKEDELASLVNYDEFTIPFNSLHPISIDEDVTQYYDLKNNFKNIANNLKTTKNPLKTSINKILNNYYALDSYPLINIQIKNAIKFDLDVLQKYLGLVKDFANSIINLECDLKDHSFYGFSKNEMRKANYTELKNTAITLSTNLQDVKKIINYGKEKYHLPSPNNLKELKALLNILTFIDEYKENPLIWLDNLEINKTYDTLKDISEKIEINRKKLNDLIDSYGPKIESINPEDIYHALNDKKPTKYLKQIKKKHLKKNIPLNEEIYLLNSLNTINLEYKKLIDQQSNYDASYHTYLKNHSFEEFKVLVDKINNYRQNLQYIKENDEFNIRQLMETTSIEKSSHRQALQIVFNSILKEANILKNYFDENIVNFEIEDFELFSKRISNMATSFVSINKYIDFYVKLSKTNKIIDGLGDELLKNGKPFEFESIFLKRFYHDLLVSYLNNKDIFQNLSFTGIKNLLNNFKDSDTKRKELISKIIYNNFNKNTRTTLQNIKNTEGTLIYNTIKNNVIINPLKNICNDVALSIHSFKPCILTSFKEVSNLLSNSEYKFDGVLILATRDIELIDILPCLSKSSHIMVSDNIAISNDIRSTMIRDDDMTKLIVACKNTYKEITFKQPYFSISSISQTNLYDLDFKAHLVKKLKVHGFEATMNHHVNNGIIDITAKTFNSNATVAIMVDHLPYYSPEDASKSFRIQENIVKENGYHLYRLFPALYFKNEEQEFKNLVNYIIEKSKLSPEIGVKKTTKLLMNYLFPLYEDPRKVLYEINSIGALNDKLKTFLNKVCPISLEELKLVFKENIENELNALIKNKEYILEEGFIYIPNEKVRFRRVDRDKNFYRPLNIVSKKEIYDAIYEIIEHKSSLNKDVIIKMILLSLGYKKANKVVYDLIAKDIDYLVSKKILFSEGNTIKQNI